MTLSAQEHIAIASNSPAHNSRQTAAHLEALLTTAWREALSQDQLGLDDDFFDLGGNSLTVLELCNRLASEGVHLAMPDVFRYPSVRALTGYLAA